MEAAPLTQAELDARIAQIHSPYHARIAALLDELRERWGAALLIDLHSMPPLARERGESAPSWCSVTGSARPVMAA